MSGKTDLKGIITSRSRPGYNFNFGYLYYALSALPYHVLKERRMGDRRRVDEVLKWSNDSGCIRVKSRRGRPSPWHWLVPRIVNKMSESVLIRVPSGGHPVWQWKDKTKASQVWLAVYVREYEVAFYINMKKWGSIEPGHTFTIQKDELVALTVWETILLEWIEPWGKVAVMDRLRGRNIC